MIAKPPRLRDFIEDRDGRLYAVAAYDNRERVGCILRYIPDPCGDRTNQEGERFRKLDFEEAYEYISREKPEYMDIIQRVPRTDVSCVLKPEVEIDAILQRSELVARLARIFDLPRGTFGVTGSYLCGLENRHSDIDMVVYGRSFAHARDVLRYAMEKGWVSRISDSMWDAIYRKRNPEISFEEFILHEKRKWNRGQLGSVYFDILYTRPYRGRKQPSSGRGTICGTRTIEATVIDASLSFDHPAVYTVDHEEFQKVLSFSHTYTGQALAGEVIQARGICEEHGSERWLIVGTTREARGEFIRSLSLIEKKGAGKKS